MSPVHHTIDYIEINVLDATVAAVRAADGTITAGPYAFPGGRRFEFSDPGGNVLGVWATS